MSRLRRKMLGLKSGGIPARSRAGLSASFGPGSISRGKTGTQAFMNDAPRIPAFRVPNVGSERLGATHRVLLLWGQLE